MFVSGDTDGVTYKFGSPDDGVGGGGEFGRIIVTFVDALRRNTDVDRLTFGVRTSQRRAALVHVHSATSSDFLHVDLVITGYRPAAGETICPPPPMAVRLAAIRYDTRCYFNVRSKADMSQLNPPHGSTNHEYGST